MRPQFSIDFASSVIQQAAERRGRVTRKPAKKSHAIHYVWAGCFFLGAIAFWTIQQAIDYSVLPITNIGGGHPSLELLSRPPKPGLAAVRIVAVRKRGECLLRETAATIGSNGAANTTIDLDPPKWRYEAGPLAGTTHMNGTITIPQLPAGTYEMCAILRWQCGPGWLPSLNQRVNCAQFSLP